MRGLGLVAALLIVAACSVQVMPSSPPTSSGGRDPVASLPTPFPEPNGGPPDAAAGLPYACNGHAFDVRLLSQPPEAHLGGDAVADALRGQTRLDGLNRAWWLTYRSATEAEFLAVNGPDLFDYTRFRQRADGTWEWNGEGDCVMGLMVEGATTVRWVLDENLPVGPQTRVIRALVSETCDPRPLIGRIQPPIVRATADTVLVAFTVRDLPVAGRLGTRVATYAGEPRGVLLEPMCAPAPPLEVDVDLGEPIGNRALVDGATWPARDARQPFEP